MIASVLLLPPLGDRAPSLLDWSDSVRAASMIVADLLTTDPRLDILIRPIELRHVVRNERWAGVHPWLDRIYLAAVVEGIWVLDQEAGRTWDSQPERVLSHGQACRAVNEAERVRRGVESTSRDVRLWAEFDAIHRRLALRPTAVLRLLDPADEEGQREVSDSLAGRIDMVFAIVDELFRHLRRGRLPDVVRRTSAHYAGRSLLETIEHDPLEDLLHDIRCSFDYARDI